jgi:hypothetical protein
MAAGILMYLVGMPVIALLRSTIWIGGKVGRVAPRPLDDFSTPTPLIRYIES